MPRVRNISQMAVIGLPKKGDRLEPGAACFVERLPDAATMQYLEVVSSDEVQQIDAENLRAVLESERASLTSARDEVGKLRVALDAAQKRAASAEREAAAINQRLQGIESERDSLRAELAVLRAEVESSKGVIPWADTPARSLLAFANRRRKALGEEPFASQGAAERAAAWLNADPSRHITAWAEEQEQGTE